MGARTRPGVLALARRDRMGPSGCQRATGATESAGVRTPDNDYFCTLMGPIQTTVNEDLSLENKRFIAFLRISGKVAVCHYEYGALPIEATLAERNEWVLVAEYFTCQ